MIYVDPSIDLQSKEMIEVIIEFKATHANIAVKSKNNLSKEQAAQLVEESHIIFRDELKQIKEKGISFSINNRYEKVFNGKSIKIKGIHIKRLLSSKNIRAIYSNHQVDLPTRSVKPWYEL